MSIWTHSPSCRWPDGEPCRQFSTDGTRLGAVIAHQMGTTSEAGITQQAFAERQARLTGMPEEQADWEEGL